MAVSPDYLAHLLDQFTGFGPVAARRMFSGAGIFRDGLMIALVVDDVLYFKTDDASRPDFQAAGMGPFTYGVRGERKLTSYYEAPAEVFDDPDIFVRWARSAHDAALRVDRARAPKGKGGTKAKAKAPAKAGPKAKAKPKTPKAKAKARPAKRAARPKAKAPRKTARRR